MGDGDGEDGRAGDPPPLDPGQVVRISAVHGGFLYQHLYGVACLLTVGRRAGVRMIVERDEDIEIAAPDLRTYVQVKTRNRALQPGDVAEALARFDTLRDEHADGRRDGAARFAIVSNREAGPVLRQRLDAPSWPKDVAFISPAGGGEGFDLPGAWPDIDDAVGWCAKAATDIPFGSLAPETLVWKLAAQVLLAATGARDRSFSAEDMPALLEQLLVQLQEFPEPPATYRPQEDEPPLLSESPFRLVVGFSGAGKTAWAAHAAIHAPGPIAYFDVGDIPAASVASALARELAARFVGLGPQGAMLAESSGLGVLRACAVRLREQGVSVTVVLDNAHRLSSEGLRGLVDAALDVRFLCIAQPWPAMGAVEAQFGIDAERLSGWSVDTIAAEFRAHDTPLTLEAAGRVLRLTAGLPLFVASAARLVREAYGRDADAFCDAIEARVHDQDTAQDLILREAVAHLSAAAKRAAAALSLSEVSLTRAEALAVLEAARLPAADAARSLREMRRHGVVTAYQAARLGLHDALRPLAADLRGELGDEIVLATRKRLRDELMMSLVKARDVPRLSAILRLLPLIGESETLAELASDEMFYEQGDPRTLREEIERVAKDPAGSAYDRYWAHDALAYWESRDGGVPDRGRLDLMADLVREGGLGPREQLALAFKQLVYFGSMGDAAAVQRTYAGARAAAAGDGGFERLLRYNYGVALGRAGAWRAVEDLADKLIADYYRLIGMREAEVLMANQRDLALKAGGVDPSELKRLGDCLALWCRARIETGRQPLLRRIHATKFYALAQAARSVVTSGQEATDDFLQLMGDPVGALEMMEKWVLPVLREAQLTDLVLPVRSHYAIVLAWLGRLSEARAELAALQQYAGDAEQVAMLATRADFVEQIAAGRVRLEPRRPPREDFERILGLQRDPRRIAKVGRNDPCPCQSGKKYKHCHGLAGA